MSDAVRSHKLQMLRNARKRAMQHNIRFDLTVDDIEIPEACPVLGILFKQSGRRGPNDHSPTLDRVRPSEGYVRGNIIVMSHLANMIKSSATAEQVMDVAAWMYEQGI